MTRQILVVTRCNVCTYDGLCHAKTAIVVMLYFFVMSLV
jgi:hypothetical protein